MPRLIPPEIGDNEVPVLDVAAETTALADERHDAALNPDDPTPLLTGQVVIVDNSDPRFSEGPSHMIVRVGGSTLREAATEVVNCVSEQAKQMPQWVASTDPELAEIVAEHFTVEGYSACDVRQMSDLAKEG